MKDLEWDIKTRQMFGEGQETWTKEMEGGGFISADDQRAGWRGVGGVEEGGLLYGGRWSMSAWV